MSSIKIAVVGVGNCASSLIQGIEYYRRKPPAEAIGLMHWNLGGYQPFDIQVVAAWDIDRRKVGLDVSRAEVMQTLKQSGAEILLNYLPVGSTKAAYFYVECALEAGMALINNIPVFIASDPGWAERFRQKGLPLIGDDIKSQLGATIINRTLADLFRRRGVRLDRMYQLNFGGNTDFMNMLNRDRLESKKISKTEAVQSQLSEPLDADQIHIGPSDWVPWLKDNKICNLRMEGRLFGDVPMHLEMRLSVEDSPNSAGVVIDAIRICKIGLERGIAGPLIAPSAYFMKHPPQQFPDSQAYQLVEDFIRGEQPPM